MRTRLALTLVLMLAAVPALATHWVDMTAQADCQGWRVDGEVKIAAAHPYLDVRYTVVLSSDGTILEEQTGTVRVELSATTSPFTVSGTWGTPPAGAAEASGTLILPFTSQGDSVQSFAIALDCGEPVSPRRPAWWIHHPGRWPVTSLVIAGEEHGRAELICLMRHGGRHRLTRRLLRHLVAARLNVLAGVPDTAAETVAAADAFLAAHGLCGHLNRAARREARRLLRELRRFNRGESAGKTLGAEPLPIHDLESETFSWGDLKAAYR